MENLILEDLKAMFALEIANKQKYFKKQIKVLLNDGTWAKISVKKI